MGCLRSRRSATTDSKSLSSHHAPWLPSLRTGSFPLVTTYLDLEGYEDFAPLENERLALPDDDEKRPHAAFLAAHRERHGFET